MGSSRSKLSCHQVCAQSVNHHVIMMQPACSPCGGGFGGYGGDYSYGGFGQGGFGGVGNGYGF